MVLGLREFTQRTGEGVGGPILDTDNGEELMRVQPFVSIVLGNRPPESHGSLYITSKYALLLSQTSACLIKIQVHYCSF